MILHSNIIGEGTPFLVLHGFLGMGDNWKTLGNRFAQQGYEMHLIDQRNHGRSFHDDAFSYEVMAEDLRKYCEHHALDSFILLGHSMGGKTAMEFAVTYPEMVTKLLVADISPKEYPSHHHHILKALSQLDFDVINSRGKADSVLAGYLDEIGVRQFLLKNLYWQEKGRLGLRMNLKVLTDKVEEVGKPLPKTAFFNNETLFLRGSRSDYIVPGDETLISHHFPAFQIVTIEGAGHWLHAENPDKFFTIVLNFL